MAYFDNAATTYPKPESVYAFMDEFYRNCGANVGRGAYKLAQTASKLVAETRELIKEILHCPAKQVIFTPTATIALNIVIKGLVELGVKNVYISPFEHNAVTRVLHHYEKSGRVLVSELAVTSSLEFDFEKIHYQFDDCKPDLLIVSHASNVIGLIAPVEELFTLAKKYNSYTLADMSQSAGLVDCDVGLSSFDFSVFAGHKTLYGPTGISGFVMNPLINLPSVLFGGTGVESASQDMPESLPERFEMGTLNILGISGLNAALKWIIDIGIDVIASKEKDNRKRLISLLQEYPWIEIIGYVPERKYVGIVSCRIEGISSDSASSIFAKMGISVRTGLQCAPLVHRFLKTFPAGTIRFSVSYFTSDDDFKELKNCLDYIDGAII